MAQQTLTIKMLGFVAQYAQGRVVASTVVGYLVQPMKSELKSSLSLSPRARLCEIGQEPAASP